MKVLLIGGPKCGRVVDVPDGAITYVTYEERTFPVTFSYYDSMVPSLPRTIYYRIERWTFREVNRVALLPVGYCWDRPDPIDIAWHVETNPLGFDELKVTLEWRPYP